MTAWAEFPPEKAGGYGSVFLWIAAFTGALIGFDFAEKAIHSLTHSPRPSRPLPPESTPIHGEPPTKVDQAIKKGQGSSG